MPVIHNTPLRHLLATRDGDDDTDSGLHMPETIMAIIIVCIFVLVGVVGLCCCCCQRKRKGSSGGDKEDGSNSSGNKKYGFEPTKWIKKAVKKTRKKIKKMFSMKNKKNSEKEGNTLTNQSVPYGQGTHPGYGENQKSMVYSGGHNDLGGHEDEETVGITSPYATKS